MEEEIDFINYYSELLLLLRIIIIIIIFHSHVFLTLGNKEEHMKKYIVSIYQQFQYRILKLFMHIYIYINAHKTQP